MLTEKSVAEGFKAAGERISEVEKNVNINVQELQLAIEGIVDQFKTYGKAFLSGNTEDGQKYNRFWQTEEQAKQFGELILKALKRKAMGESTQAGGGVLVPDELSARMIQKLGVYGKFRANATVVTLGSDRQIVPKVETDLTVYCPGEGAEITKSDMDFSQVGLTAKAWCALIAVSNELIEDSIIGVGEIVGISMARSMAKKEDLVGFIGDGTETYFGMTGVVGALRGVDATIGNIKGLVVAAGNAYAEITLANFREVVGILPEDCDDTAKWFMSKKFYYNVVYPLAEDAGVANIFEILSDRKARFLLGYEVVFVPAMPSVEADSQICALLGDLQLGAFLGERKVLTIEQSSDFLFTNNQLAIRGIERIDISVCRRVRHGGRQLYRRQRCGPG